MVREIHEIREHELGIVSLAWSKTAPTRLAATTRDGYLLICSPENVEHYVPHDDFEGPVVSVAWTLTIAPNCDSFFENVGFNMTNFEVSRFLKIKWNYITCRRNR